MIVAHANCVVLTVYSFNRVDVLDIAAFGRNAAASHIAFGQFDLYATDSLDFVLNCCSIGFELANISVL
jgi:hypothetical protein